MEITNKIAIYVLVYIILPIILILSCKKQDKKDILSKDTTDAIKGFLVIYVAIHHYVQKIFNPELLNPLNYVGFLCVSFFFLMSGYGLTLSYYKHENLKGFFKKRFLRLYFPFVVSNILIGVLDNITIKSGYSIKDILITSFTLRTIDGSVMLWYIFVQILMYIFFYISFTILKNKNSKILCVIIFTLVYIFIAKYLGQGAWRYNTCLCFSVGVIIAAYKDNLKNVFEKYSIGIIGILFTVFLASWHLAIKGVYSYYVTFICAIIFALLLVAITYKINFKSKIYNYIGNISYEFYIIQLPVIEMILNLIGNNILGIYLVLLTTVSISIITNKTANYINCKID